MNLNKTPGGTGKVVVRGFASTGDCAQDM